MQPSVAGPNKPEHLLIFYSPAILNNTVNNASYKDSVKALVVTLFNTASCVNFHNAQRRPKKQNLKKNGRKCH